MRADMWRSFVSYIRTTPTPSLLLFIPYKCLVGKMIKFRITKEKEGTFKFFLSLKA